MEREVVELLKRVAETEPVEFGQGFAIYDNANVVSDAEKLALKLGLTHVARVLVATRPGWLYLQLMSDVKSVALHIWERGTSGNTSLILPRRKLKECSHLRRKRLFRLL